MLFVVVLLLLHVIYLGLLDVSFVREVDDGVSSCVVLFVLCGSGVRCVVVVVVLGFVIYFYVSALVLCAYVSFDVLCLLSFDSVGCAFCFYV